MKTLFYINARLNFCFISAIIFLTSCTNNELTKETAMPLVAKYYGLGDSLLENNAKDKNTSEAQLANPSFHTQIAIDMQFKDIGWMPGKYNDLAQQGIINLQYSPPTGWTNLHGYYNASIAEKGKKYYVNNRNWQTSTDGNKEQLVFTGYVVSISNLSVSSNAKEKTAIAQVDFSISEISPIQQLFSPLKTTSFNRSVYFRLFDDGWKIEDTEKSHINIKSIDNPCHWMGN